MRWRCICIRPTNPQHWLRRLTHPWCPKHGNHQHRQVAP
jgi:hypothetical protein